VQTSTLFIRPGSYRPLILYRCEVLGSICSGEGRFSAPSPKYSSSRGVWNPGMAALLAQKIIEVEEELVSNTTSLGVDAQVNEIKGQSSHETIKKKIWFDIVRPTKDTKELKVLVGSKPEEKRERREEVITW
jgi:hypothetical protein